MSDRTPFTNFGLPVPELRRGYYTAVYFWREKRILERERNERRALMQVFNKVDGATVCGVDETLAMLRLATGFWRDYEAMYPLFDRYIEVKQARWKANSEHRWEDVIELTTESCDLQRRLEDLWCDTHSDLTIHALREGDVSRSFEAVVTIEGRASDFAHLESVYLGVLARGTKVATNTRKVVEAAAGKSVLFFADRFDRWQNQAADGYAALQAGALGVATDAMGHWWGVSGLGTTSHALIALYRGDTVAATLAFAKQYPDVSAIALVDFDNDCVATSLDVARAFAEAGKELWGVRLDTAGTMVDKSVVPLMGDFNPSGVCAPLVEHVRSALDKEGFSHVKIVVSGGFNAERVRQFEREGVSVDAYGVGSALLGGNYDYTADIVMVEGEPMAKKGRQYRPGAGLTPFSWDEIEPPDAPPP